MAKQGSGVILTLSTPGSRSAGQGFIGYGVTCGAIETFSRILAGELGASRLALASVRDLARHRTARRSSDGMAKQPIEGGARERLFSSTGVLGA